MTDHLMREQTKPDIYLSITLTCFTHKNYGPEDWKNQSFSYIDEGYHYLQKQKSQFHLAAWEIGRNLH